MNKISIHILSTGLLILLAILTISSCTKDVIEVDTNPNFTRVFEDLQGNITDAVIDQNGDLYLTGISVIDTRQLVVRKTNSLGYELWTYNTTPMNPNIGSSVYKITLLSNNNLLVTNKNNDEILMLNSEGVPIFHKRYLGDKFYIPAAFPNDGELFSNPVVDEAGNVYISATYHNWNDHALWQIHEDGSVTEIVHYENNKTLNGIFVNHWYFNVIKVTDDFAWITANGYQNNHVGQELFKFNRNTNTTEIKTVTLKTISTKLRDDPLAPIGGPIENSNGDFISIGRSFPYTAPLYANFYPSSSNFRLYRSTASLDILNREDIGISGLALFPYLIVPLGNGNFIVPCSYDISSYKGNLTLEFNKDCQLVKVNYLDDPSGLTNIYGAAIGNQNGLYLFGGKNIGQGSSSGHRWAIIKTDN